MKAGRIVIIKVVLMFHRWVIRARVRCSLLRWDRVIVGRLIFSFSLEQVSEGQGRLSWTLLLGAQTSPILENRGFLVTKKGDRVRFRVKNLHWLHLSFLSLSTAHSKSAHDDSCQGQSSQTGKNSCLLNAHPSDQALELLSLDIIQELIILLGSSVRLSLLFCLLFNLLHNLFNFSLSHYWILLFCQCSSYFLKDQRFRV